MTLTNQERAWRHQFTLVQEGLEQDREFDKEDNIYSAQDMRDAFAHGWQAAKADQPAPTSTQQTGVYGPVIALANPPGPRGARLVDETGKRPTTTETTSSASPSARSPTGQHGRRKSSRWRTSASHRRSSTATTASRRASGITRSQFEHGRPS